MKRRVLLSSAAPLLISGCSSYHGWFDLEWDEEVQLPDERVIVVHLKHSFERFGGFFEGLENGFSRYGGRSIARDSELTLDPGNGIGRITQLFKGFHPIFLGQNGGQWYAVLFGSYYYRSQEIPGQDWGEGGTYGQVAIQLIAERWTPISMSRLPAEFQIPNVMLLNGEAKELSAFNQKTVTLQDKEKWQVTHPPDNVRVRLVRPKSPTKHPDRISTSPEDSKQ
ncbi:hypothetical protein SDC9_99073 [bioreactor metagenome]|uniref:Uncharacterized protein n=1 Tax=bioreactor metagenome TaxID=1076179 RepID=A0A645ARU3_9ZZZZ